MCCTAGVHEEVGKLVEKFVPPDARESTRVLDLGAGAGALCQRMYDLGFKDITAWDLNPENLQDLADLKIDGVDLNSDFGDQANISGQFDLIIAVEIIEHLENPYHFARQLKLLLAPDGTVIVSTPNIESAASRIHFLRSADFRWFSDYFYQDSGHITPLTIWQLTKIYDRARLQIAEQSHTMHDAIVIRDKGGPGTYRTPLFALAIYPFMLGHRDGDIHVMAVQHRQEM